MDPNAVLGSLDPQLGQHPAASIVHAVDWKTERAKDIDDETLILAIVARKAMVQLRNCVRGVLLQRFAPEKADELASLFTRGEWTHDHPLDVEALRGLGSPSTRTCRRRSKSTCDSFRSRRWGARPCSTSPCPTVRRGRRPLAHPRRGEA